VRQQEFSGYPPREASSNGSATLAPPALAESWGAEELAAALDSVGAGIWAVDLEGRCVFINQAACRIFGYAREECLGQNLQCRIHKCHPDGWCCPKHQCPIQSALASGSGAWVDDDVFQHRDGTSFPAQYSVQPVAVQGRIRGAVINMTDIASRKRAEESLRKSDEWLGFAQHAAAVGIFDLDLKTGEAQASEGQFRLYGLDPAGKWPSHEGWRQLVHPEDRERMDREIELAISGAQVSGEEFRIVWPDGSIHWLCGQPTAFFDEAGTATRVVGANVDVTSRVRAETVLNQFFSASPTPMAIWGFDARIRQANRAWEPILGYATAELEGLNVLDLVHPEDRAVAAAEFKELVISGKRIGFECRTRCKDGSYRWLLMNASVLKDAQVICATAHDIMNRKAAEEALRQSEARFRSAFDNTLIGMAIVGLDGRYLQVSRSLCRITGFSEQELLLTDFSAITHPDDVREGLEFRHAMMEGVKSAAITTKRYVRKDGKLVWVSVPVALVRDALGKPLHFITLVEDISERKRAEEALRESREQLRSITDSAQDAILMVDARGAVTYWNPAAESIFGYRREEAIGESLHKLLAPERYLEAHRAAFAEFSRTGRGNAVGKTVELAARRKDGREISVDLSLSAIRLNGEWHAVGIARDITERKRAEEALRESEAKFRELFDCAPVAYHELDMDGVVRRVNRAECALLGYEAGEMLGRPVWEFIAGAERESSREAVRRKLSGEQPLAPYQRRYVRRDGVELWVEVHETLVRSATGQTAGIRTALLDIAERKRAEERIEKTLVRQLGVSQLQQMLLASAPLEDKLRKVTDAIVSLFDADFCRIWLIRPGDLCERGCPHAEVREGPHVCQHRDRCLHLLASSGRYTHIDGPGHRRVPFGCYKIGRVASDEVPKLVTNDVQSDANVHNHAWARELGLVSFAGYQLRSPGEETLGVLALFAKHPILAEEDAMLSGLGSTVARVVKQAVAEETLRAKESTLSESQRIAHVGSWNWDLPIGTPELAWTPETYRVFGVSQDTFIPSAEAFQSLIHADDRAAMRAWMSACLAGEEPPDLEFRVGLRDGGVRYLLGRGHLVRDAENKPIRMTGIAQDITERRCITEALKLNIEKLARSNEELERFAYVASHDLQEPLRMVASFTQLLAKRYSGRLDETADRYIDYAVDGAKRMQELIADLLAYSRVNSKELALRQTDCGEVILEAMRNLQVAIEESGASVDWDPLPALWADQGQLIHLFQNLLGNAIKFRKKEECPRIHVSAVDSGGEWVISVQDNGIGIDTRQAERIFQIFQRLHTRAEYPGTGIGLAVCQKVVERLGGKLWVESELGVGSTFRFTIPKPIEKQNKR